MLPSAVHLSSRPRRHRRRRAYPPRLEILHHAFNRNLVQQHKIADADVVLAHHLASPHTRTRDARNESTGKPTRPTTARDRPARTDGWLAWCTECSPLVPRHRQTSLSCAANAVASDLPLHPFDWSMTDATPYQRNTLRVIFVLGIDCVIFF